MNENKSVLVIDIDDTLFVHKTNILEYHLKAQLQRIQYPKYIRRMPNFSMRMLF